MIPAIRSAETDLSDDADARNAMKASQMITLAHRLGLMAGMTLVLGVTCLAPAASFAQSSGLIANMAGAFKGSGSVRLETGKSERIRCQGKVTRKTATSLSHALRCAGIGGTFSIGSTMRFSGNSVTGHWRDVSNGLAGRLSGKAGKTTLRLTLTSGGANGSMRIDVAKCSQTILISSAQGNVRRVSIKLKKIC